MYPSLINNMLICFQIARDDREVMIADPSTVYNNETQANKKPKKTQVPIYLINYYFM